MRPTFLFVSLTLALLCASFVTAQALPDAPSKIVASDIVEVPPPFLNPAAAIQPGSPKRTTSLQVERSTVVDKKFMLIGSLILATTTADMELTQHCQNAGTCVELNPTIPRARWAKHAVNVPTNVGVMYWAYKWKKQGKRLWWVPPMVDIAVHAVGLGSNLRFAF